MAEDIFKQFKEHSVAEFFKKNRQMLGFSGKVRSMTIIVHEYVTNSVSWDTPTVVKADGTIKIIRIGELTDELIKNNNVDYSLDGEVESLRKFKKFEVLCFDKAGLKMKFKEVKSIHRHKMKKGEKLIKVNLLGGRSVEITKHHSAFTLSNGNVVPLKGGEIEIGSQLIVPRIAWAGQEEKGEINILEESLKLTDDELDEFSVFGVKDILYQNREVLDKIKAPLSGYQKNHDFYANYMKCDRIPVRLLRALDERERSLFYSCTIGYRKSKERKIGCVMPITKELMQLLGLYVAEGNTRKSLQGCSLSFGSHEKELIEVAKNLVMGVFLNEASEAPAHKTATNVVIASKTVAFLIAKIFECGKKAKEKRVPDIVFNVTPELAFEFLCGYLAGDGYPSKKFTEYLEGNVFDIKNKITLATASGELATGLEYLLSALGYSYSKQISPVEERTINKIKTKFSQAHIIEFYPLQKNSPLNSYPIEIGGIGEINEPKISWGVRERRQKSITYEKIISLTREQITLNEAATKFIASDLGVLPVISLQEREASENEYVYDYSVDGDENFVGGYGAICLHNSLDAAEEAGILPEIFVQVEEMNRETKDHYRITVKDNGPGIPKSHLGKALGQMLAGTKFHRYIQQRGQQGIGAAACTMYSYLTTGQPTKAISCHKGKKLTTNISIDFRNNKPIVEELSDEPTEESGLCVTAEFKDVRYERSNQGIYEYLRRTALANPHCTITLVEPNNEKSVFPRSIEVNPQKPFEIKPHPLGITTHDLLEFARINENKKISSFLQSAFSRVSAAKVDELRTLAPDVDFDKRPGELAWEDAEKIVKAFAQVKWIAPAMDSLVPIGKGQIETSFRNIFNPEIVVVTERSPRVYRGGIPFMVEAGIAYGGGLAAAEKKGEVMRFANRVPLLFDNSGCAISETIKSIEWNRYSMKKFEEEPVAVLVNLLSVHVPYTSAGKQAISSEEDIAAEIKLAVMEAGRTIQRYLSGKRKAHEIETKRKVISRYIDQLSGDLSELAGTKNKADLRAKLEHIVGDRYTEGGSGEEENEGVPPDEEERVKEEENVEE